LGRGHVTEWVERFYKDFSGVGFYLCGSQKMVEGLKDRLKQRGVKEKNIHHERFC
jgi:ferredoxin-NADP reductase